MNSLATETRLAVQKLDELPPMSFAVHEFLRAVEDSDVGVRELGQIIERDPALLARIVGLANAAFFGVKEPVTTAEEAIFKVLGVNTAKSLALSIVLSGPFDSTRCRGFRLDRYWSVAISTALLAQRLARHVQVSPQPSGGEAYLCGLLHNLGLLALVHLYPQQMSVVFDDFYRGRGELNDLERSALGADHCSVGGWLTRKWHLRQPVTNTVEHYKDFTYQGDAWPTVRLVGACSQWSKDFWLSSEEEKDPDWAPYQQLGLAPLQVEEAIDDVKNRKHEIKTMAGVLAR